MVRRHVFFHLFVVALLALATFIISLTTPRASEAYTGSPQLGCENRTVCPAVFYYNRFEDAEVATLNQSQLLVLNHIQQLDGPNAFIQDIDADTVVILYHLFSFVPENGYEYDWPTINANEDWFLHETDDPTITGRIPFPDSTPPYTYWFMDVSNPEYQAFALETYQGLLDDFPNLDGFYLDFPSFYGVPPGPGCTGFACYTLTELTCDDTGTCPTPFLSEANWNNFYGPALIDLNDALGDVYLVHNDFLVPPFTATQNGSFGEHFFHAGFANENSWYTESSWENQVNSMQNADLSDRVTLILSGQNTNTATTQILRFSLASYLLGRQTTAPALFYFDNRTNPVPQYYPLYDVDLGQPAAPYQSQCSAGTCVYTRNYTKGMVVVNPTTVEKSKILSGQFRDLDDAVVTTVTLPAHSAQLVTDITAPAIPKLFRTTSVSSSSVAFTWEEATENHYLAAYRVYRNGVVLQTTTGLTLTDASVVPGVSYTYTIDAIDGAGNTSSQSSALIVDVPLVGDITAPSTINDLTAS